MWVLKQILIVFKLVSGFETRTEPTFRPTPTSRAPSTTQAPKTTARPSQNLIDQEPRKNTLGWDSNLGEEEDLAELKNLELNSSEALFESLHVNFVLLLCSLCYLAVSRLL